MKFRDETPKDQRQAIRFVVELGHAPEKVWRAVTDPVLLSEWLLPVAGLRLDPGAAFTFTTDPHPGWDGSVHCQVLEVDAPRRLSYTWRVGDMLDTVVTFILTPTPDGTELQIVQTGFREGQQQNFAGARYGWRMMGERLVNLLEEEI